jgi:aryl-alcohol dehydrogenase-like predicted oxidoreductase
MMRVSNHNLEEIKQATAILSEEGFKISAVQNHYSLKHRTKKQTSARAAVFTSYGWLFIRNEFPLIHVITHL